MGTIDIAKFGNTAIAAYGDSRMERKTIANYKKESIQNLNTHRYLKNQTAAATKEYIEIYARFNSKYDFPRTNSKSHWEFV